MAHCSCLQVLRSGCLLCQRVSLSLAVFLLPFELFFLQQRLQGWVHSLWTAWQGCNSSICWKPSKGVADSRVWPLAAVYHRNWPCLCLHVIWKFLGNKQSSGLGVIVSASALQIMRSSFKRSLKQYYTFLKGKCDCSWLLRCTSSVWGGGEECRAQSNEGGKGERLPVHVQLPQKGRLNLQKANREREIAHRVWCCWWGPAGSAGVFLVSGSTWSPATFWSRLVYLQPTRTWLFWTRQVTGATRVNLLEQRTHKEIH